MGPAGGGRLCRRRAAPRCTAMRQGRWTVLPTPPRGGAVTSATRSWQLAWALAGTTREARDGRREAYQVCESITRRRRATSTTASGCCRPRQAPALCALYALSRRIDDIGDGDLPLAEKAAALAESAPALRDIDTSTDPVLVAVADAASRYPVPLGAFDELVQGVEMDVAGERYETFETWSATAGASRGRWGGCVWACSARRADAAASTYTPTRSVSRCSRPTSSVTSGRTCSTGGSTCRSRSSGVRGRAGRRRVRRVGR